MKQLIAGLVVFGALSGCIKQNDLSGVNIPREPTPYEVCVESGGRILELDPRQCKDNEGNVYAETVRGDVKALVDDNSQASPSAVQCVDGCGNGSCDENACQEEECICLETAISCPSDCK